MPYQITRSQTEIDDLLNKVQQAIDAGETRFKGQTFEEGIHDVIRWLIGESDDYPYPEE